MSVIPSLFKSQISYEVTGHDAVLSKNVEEPSGYTYFVFVTSGIVVV